MTLIAGFATILIAVLSGAALAHAGVLDVSSQRTLAEISFFVATPALMVTTIGTTAIEGAAPNFVASAIALGMTFAIYAFIAGVRWKLDAGSVLIGAMTSSYVNAGNLGLALAAFVVGDITVVVPTLLLQMLIVQPLALTVLDRRAATGIGATRLLRRMITNPLTISAVMGLTLAVSGWALPEVIDQPLRLLAGAAIPLMLMSYGAALRLSPPPGRAGHNREVVTASVLKLAFMPIVAWLAATSLGIEGAALTGVVLTAALPTAQNIFLHATRYRSGEAVAREGVLVSTLLSAPVTVLILVVLR